MAKNEMLNRYFKQEYKMLYEEFKRIKFDEFGNQTQENSVKRIKTKKKIRRK